MTKHHTPDEREITKQQLWDRDYEFLDLINGAIKTFTDQLNEVTYRLNMAFDEKTKTGVDSINEFKKELERHYIEKQKELEKVGHDTVSELSRLLDKKTTEFVDVMEVYRQNVNQETQTNLHQFYSNTYKNIDSLTARIDSQTKALSYEIQKTQVDLGKKLGDMSHMFIEIKTKFKKMSEQLQ